MALVDHAMQPLLLHPTNKHYKQSLLARFASFIELTYEDELADQELLAKPAKGRQSTQEVPITQTDQETQLRVS